MQFIILKNVEKLLVNIKTDFSIIYGLVRNIKTFINFSDR
jgi:hypothetical protein